MEIRMTPEHALPRWVGVLTFRRSKARGPSSPCVSIADFNALRSRRHDEELQLYAFDVLGLDGEDLSGLPLSLRKTNLARLLRGRSDGIFVAPFEQGEIGPDLFRAACNWGFW
jgi:ATP-dependent DNA ligase